MTAYQKNIELARRLQARGIDATIDQADTLRRAERTLQRWAEHECGDSNDYCSTAIERDDETGLPYRCTNYHDGHTTRDRVADREAGALRRIKALCDTLADGQEPHALMDINGNKVGTFDVHA